MSKVVVVTGASKGIGAATAVTFGKNGYDVVINYHDDDEAAKQIVKEVEVTGSKAVAVKSDIFTETGVNELFKVVKEQFGKVDVLINNAGNPNELPLGEYTFQTIVDSLSANLISSVLSTQAAEPLMADGGSILFTSSIFGLPYGGNTDLVLYSAGKAAIINFAQTMAEKLAPSIRCNIVAPGFTKTPAWDGESQETVDNCLNTTLQKEWVTSEEIAQAFLFLANTQHMTGETITIDAGWQKKTPNHDSKRR